MNQATREEVIRLARKMLTARQIAIRINEGAVAEFVTVEEVEQEIERLQSQIDLAQIDADPDTYNATAKTRTIRRAEVVIYDIEQTWTGTEWEDGDADPTYEEDFAEARVGDELNMNRLEQLAEDLTEFARANANRMEIRNVKAEG